MKLDTHVHSFHSGYSTIYPLTPFLRECYNTPEGVYRLGQYLRWISGRCRKAVCAAPTSLVVHHAA